MYLTNFVMICWLMVMTICNQVEIDTVTATTLFTKSDANKILGSPSHLTDCVVKKDSYLCGYQTDAADQKTGKIGALYFFFESYNDMADANKRYEDVYRSNQAHGMEKVNLWGEEALYHTDHQKFDLMMVRKGKYVFSIKINKRTSTTSLTALKYALKRISDQLKLK
ncbi:MAG: hypothetical protein JWR50_1326 [Mucilaginibacter sp.]|nr:hypothetical protein [Mucilaginibacter sp.]